MSQDLTYFFATKSLLNMTLEDCDFFKKNHSTYTFTYPKPSPKPYQPQLDTYHTNFTPNRDDKEYYTDTHTNWSQNQSCMPSIVNNYQTYEEYYTDIANLTKEQILKRMSVIKNFLFYPKQTIEAIIQQEIVDFQIKNSLEIGDVTLFIRESYCHRINQKVCAGFWIQNIPNYSNYQGKLLFGFDIISLCTFLYRNTKRQYSQSVDEIYDFFSTRDFIRRNSEDTGKEFYIQERNPISVYNPAFFDLFFTHFHVLSISTIVNVHSRIIGSVWGIKTINGDYIEIYHTFWRHTKSQIFKLVPLPPQPSYETYSITYQYDYNYDNIVLCGSVRELYKLENDHTLNKIIQNKFKVFFVYGGIKNLQITNLNSFSDKSLYIIIDDTFTYTNLKTISRLVKENNIKECFLLKLPTAQCVSINAVLINPEKLGLTKPETVKLLATPDDKIQGSNRKRCMILDPIIESGTITWLFAKEKAGKTILALFLAQIIASGNKNIGTWKAHQPKKVLYIDGEMPGDKLQQHIEKIIRGYSGTSEIEHRAFSVYLFSEGDFLYEDILDDSWQNEHIDELLEYDLIILDNYYTLYASLNPIKLLRWMKTLTQKGIAFLVLDHTNSEGELQGSIVKKRAMDLGLKLEMLEKNTIDISFQSDRYGREHQAESFSLIPCFTTAEFSYETQLVYKDTPDLKLSDDDTELMLIYILKTQGLKNKEVAQKIETSDANITKKLKKIAFDAGLKTINTDTNKAALCKQKEILKKYEKYKKEYDDKLIDMIEYVKNK